VHRLSLAVVSLVLGCATRAAAQVATVPQQEAGIVRTATISGGVGNAHGWYGAEGEWHLGRNRSAVFVGAGYTPRSEPDYPAGATAAVGVRVFTDGARHRLYGELSLSQIGLERAGLVYTHGRRVYGPGAQLGYEYLTSHQWTLSASAGAGYGLGVSRYANPWQPMVGLAIGYTWLTP
jgi:hypothetical protein